jgi:hypothetical protein
MQEYKKFLFNKIQKPQSVGFDLDVEAINPFLFDWQREIVKWALRLGRAALFEDTGLGKTIQQVEWAKHVAAHANGRVLIVCPLAVAHQTIGEGKKIGVPIEYVRSQAAADASICDVVITNYDMLKEFTAKNFVGVVLDESSILKQYTGATKRMILEMFNGMRFKLACTATPAPNDHLELGNHAQFLEVMESNEMISRWFINDTMRAGGYKLKGPAPKDGSWILGLFHGLPYVVGYDSWEVGGEMLPDGTGSPPDGHESGWCLAGDNLQVMDQDEPEKWARIIHPDRHMPASWDGPGD